MTGVDAVQQPRLGTVRGSRPVFMPPRKKYTTATPVVTSTQTARGAHTRNGLPCTSSSRHSPPRHLSSRPSSIIAALPCNYQIPLHQPRPSSSRTSVIDDNAPNVHPLPSLNKLFPGELMTHLSAMLAHALTASTRGPLPRRSRATMGFTVMSATLPPGASIYPSTEREVSSNGTSF